MKLTLQNASRVSGLSIVIGAVMLIPGALILSEKINASMALGAVLLCLGLFGILFGFTVNAARRMAAGFEAMGEGEKE